MTSRQHEPGERIPADETDLDDSAPISLTLTPKAEVLLIAAAAGIAL